MINPDTGTRMLAYTEQVTAVCPIEAADNLEAVYINGWECVCGKGEFQVGDLGVFFEIDSKLPEVPPFSEMSFLKSKNYKIKTQKIRGQISQGLFLSLSAFAGADWNTEDLPLHKDLTHILGVTYIVPEDNMRKAEPLSQQERIQLAHKKFFGSSIIRRLMKNEKCRYIFLGLFKSKKKDNPKRWPVGKFAGVNKTDQERVENIPWVLNDKNPCIVTEKCDGTSATYILAKQKFHKYEFYVCSRNIRQLKKDKNDPNNVYWRMALNYDIENKMLKYLKENPDVSFVCWQGEICGPGIQNNRQSLSNYHLFCFHMTDSKTGRFNILKAKEIWDSFEMETVPIVNQNYILPDTLEELKIAADGYYDPSVCEGKKDCPREGYVYYNVLEPTISFKNVSRKYLLKYKE